MSLDKSDDVTCKVVNSVGFDQFTFMVNVLQIPVIEMIPNEKEVKVREGSALNLTCIASGNPVPTITWTGGNSNALLKLDL